MEKNNDLKKRLGKDYDKMKDFVKKLAGGDPDAIFEALKARFPKKIISTDEINVWIPRSPRR